MNWDFVKLGFRNGTLVRQAEIYGREVLLIPIKDFAYLVVEKSGKTWVLDSITMKEVKLMGEEE